MRLLKTLFQNEGLNGGGTLFVNKHPNLKVRVVHGNTLTAAVILHEIPEDVDEVFLTGATSKLGRAIALYLARRRVKVLVRTNKKLVSFPVFFVESAFSTFFQFSCLRNLILTTKGCECRC